MSKDRVLGKGLSALIQGADMRGGPVAPADADAVRRLDLDTIGFNPDQPRKTFDHNGLEELAASIRQVGVLQPVLVRRLEAGERAVPHADSPARSGAVDYCVVAGERRVRAARLAGLAQVPALVCSYAETEALKVALLENIQREDLGTIEEAEAYRNLMDAYGATQEELAEMLGKKRSSVANLLRILTLEPEILALIQDRRLSAGHAKALLGLPAGPGRVQLGKLGASRGLSVREIERRVQSGGAKPRRRRTSTAGAAGGDPAIRALRERVEQTFGSPTVIERDAKTGKGTISLRFYGDDDLVRLLKMMGVDTDL
ncbi:MAG: ParB/RepB/Spo0J family partition protein [Candidatus Krumholzibacteriia bacterium]